MHTRACFYHCGIPTPTSPPKPSCDDEGPSIDKLMTNDDCPAYRWWVKVSGPAPLTQGSSDPDWHLGLIGVRYTTITHFFVGSRS